MIVQFWKAVRRRKVELQADKVERPADEMRVEEKNRRENGSQSRKNTQKGSGGLRRMRRVWPYPGRACLGPWTNPQTSVD